MVPITTLSGVGLQTTNDPDFYLAEVEFMSLSMEWSHPFQIQDTQNGTVGNPYDNGVTNNGHQMEQSSLKFHSTHLILFIISVLHTPEWVELFSSIQLSDNPINTKNSCKQWRNY